MVMEKNSDRLQEGKIIVRELEEKNKILRGILKDEVGRARNMA